MSGLAAFAGSAHAGGIIPTVTCAAIDPSRGGAAHVVTFPNGVNVTVSTGEIVSWTSPAPNNVNVTTNGVGPVLHGAAGSATATANGTIAVVHAGAVINVSVTCALASTTTGGTGGDAGSTVSADGQNDNAGGGVGNNSGNQFGGGGGNSVSQNRVFVSTQSLNSGMDFNAWLSADWRSYGGGISGSGYDIAVGIDGGASTGTILGILMAYGRQSVTDSSGR